MDIQRPLIDRASHVPVYQQLADWMIENISTGEWHAGFQIPAEPNLAEELDVSRGTLRKTIGLLVQRGLLVQAHGKGTFVASSLIDQPLASNLTSVSEEFIRTGTAFSTNVIRQLVSGASAKEAGSLGLPVGAPVLVLERVRSVGSEPVVLNESYLPADPFGDLIDVDFRTARLFEVIESRFPVVLSRSTRAISAIAANRYVAQALHVSTGSPVLYSEQVVYDDGDRQVEFSKAWFRGDRFRLSSVATRSSSGDAHSVTIPLAWELSGAPAPN